MLRAKEVYNILTNFEPRDWLFFLIDYVLHGLLPDDPKEAASIRRRSLRFYYDPIVKTLYRRSYDGILLHCLSVIPRSRNTYLVAYSVFRSYFSIYFLYLTDFNFKYHFPILYIFYDFLDFSGIKMNFFKTGVGQFR